MTLYVSATASDVDVSVDIDLDADLPCSGHRLDVHCPNPARWRVWRSCCNARAAFMCDPHKAESIDNGWVAVCGFCDAVHIPGNLFARRIEPLSGRAA